MLREVSERVRWETIPCIIKKQYRGTENKKEYGYEL